MSEYISNLKIKNYRSCRNTSVDITNELTVLIGKNGTGKTNILNALMLLKQISRVNLHRRRVSEESFLTRCEIFLQYHQKNTVSNLKFTVIYDVGEKNSDNVIGADVSLKRQGEKKWSKKMSVENINSFLQTSARYKEISGFKDWNLDFQKAYNLPIESSENIEIINSVIDYFSKMTYFGATQFSNPSQCPLVLEINERGLRSPYGISDYHHRFLYDLYKTSIDDVVFFKNYIELVSSEGLGLIRDIEFKSQIIESNSYEVRTGGDLRKTKKDKSIIIPYVGIDGLNLSFNQLSEGTFKTLALVFYILQNKNTMMLIEEPEVCVHHGLLGSIIELIQQKAKEQQIIVSTHSDYILDKVNPENVILVEKINEFGTEAKLLSDKLSKNDYKALKNYLQEIGNLGDYWKETNI